MVDELRPLRVALTVGLIGIAFKLALPAPVVFGGDFSN